MTVLTFPSSPILGQTYNAPNGLQYVYDGVKWGVESITSSSEAVTNLIQDRVAPLFVDGIHNGISVTYNITSNQLSMSLDIDGGNAETIF
jgi:hypothetical protein